MYRRRLTETQFADTLDEIEVSDRSAVGPATVITGESEQYGQVVLVQTFDDFAAIYEIAQGDEDDIEPTQEELDAHRAMIARGASGSL